MKINNVTSYTTKAQKSKKTPNFKAIIIRPKARNNIPEIMNSSSDFKKAFQRVWDSIVAHLEKLKPDFANYKNWDLIVKQNQDDSIHFILASKLFPNKYNAKDILIKQPSLDDAKTGKSYLELCLTLESTSDTERYEPHLFSNNDNLLCTDTGFTDHQVYFKFDTFNDMLDFYRRIRAHKNFSRPHMVDTGIYQYPLQLLEAFEKMQYNEFKIEMKKENNECRPKTVSEQQSYIVELNHDKNKDGEIIKGFNKVAGMDELKKTLEQDIIYPLKNTELCKKYGIEPLNGMLFYGKPGTGKTFMAEALAEECERTFLSMDVSKIVSAYVGETSKNIAALFKEAEKNKPSIVFIDEVDALCPSRGKIDETSSSSIGYNQSVSTLLQEMNNCSKKEIFVICATNHPEKIDPALLRAGRIDKSILIPPPDAKAREELFKQASENSYIDKNIDYAKLADLTEGYLALDIKYKVVREAAWKAMKEQRSISMEDLLEQIKVSKSKINNKQLEGGTSKIGFIFPS